MIKKTTGKIKNVGANLALKAQQLWEDERGELSAMTWVIGSAVVVALVIAALMVAAPNTAETMWESFVNYAKKMFGI